MNPELNLPLLYRTARLIDLQIPHPEIAARTGLTQDEVREVEAWALGLSDQLSARGLGALTATESLILWYLSRWAGTAARAGESAERLRADQAREMVEAFGAEETSQIAEAMDSLAERGILRPLMGVSFSDLLSEEEDGFEVPEVELLDPRAWEGPPSRMVAELLVEEASKWEETPELTLIYRILRKDTLRVLIDTGEFIAILDQVAKQESTGFRADARWPNPGPIYIELTGDLPEIPEEDKEVIHSYIISEDSGDGTRIVMIPTDTPDGSAATSVMLNTRTGEITGLFGEEREWGTAIEMSRRLIAFLTDENYEFVEMPLSRTARRRLQRSGAPNPWHVVQRREDPR